MIHTLIKKKIIFWNFHWKHFEAPFQLISNNKNIFRFQQKTEVYRRFQPWRVYFTTWNYPGRTGVLCWKTRNQWSKFRKTRNWNSKRKKNGKKEKIFTASTSTVWFATEQLQILHHTLAADSNKISFYCHFVKINIFSLLCHFLLIIEPKRPVPMFEKLGVSIILIQ